MRSSNHPLNFTGKVTNMRITMGLIIFLCLIIFGHAQPNSPSTTNPLKRPKLVVAIVVDQMRWDFLYRYYNRYGNGGFRRLLRNGYRCENVKINYLPSQTGPGHTCIFTGSVPAIAGIAANEWIEQLSGKLQYCVGDTSVQSVGTSSSDGRMSPHNLLVSTITDELRIATNFQSKVVGISLKDRAAILPVGHTANAAFWLDDSTGHFISSTYYFQQLPEWVNQFNNSNEIKGLIKNDWNTLYPVKTYIQSDSDDQTYEGKFRVETTPVFPHAIQKAYEKNKVSFRSTPFGNTFTLDFAKAAVKGYQLGAGVSTDFLAINLASTDYVGHMFGPNSIEIEDTYLRLDQELSKFFSFLDEKIGKGGYTVFLTADHGVAHAIGYMQKHQLPSESMISRPIFDGLNKLLAEKIGTENLVRTSMNSQINFDMPKVFANHLDFDLIKKMTVEFLQKQPGVSFAVDINEIGKSPVPEPLKTMIINGYNFKRSGSVQVVLNPGWFETSYKTGTTHGTWYAYDTHIPLVFMGWGIQRGSTQASINMTDIAPTIAGLLHIQIPSGSIGTPIVDLFFKKPE